jgi:hypothetical protein
MHATRMTRQKEYEWMYTEMVISMLSKVMITLLGLHNTSIVALYHLYDKIRTWSL